MLMNNAVSIIVGLIPIAGDVILAAYKANSRNAILFEEYLRIRGEEFIKMENKKADEAKKGIVKGKNGTSYIVLDIAVLILSWGHYDQSTNRHPILIWSKLNRAPEKIPSMPRRI
jgi:hypothetical protein